MRTILPKELTTTEAKGIVVKRYPGHIPEDYLTPRKVMVIPEERRKGLKI